MTDSYKLLHQLAIQIIEQDKKIAQLEAETKQTKGDRRRVRRVIKDIENNK